MTETDNDPPRIVADIGGTNARFGLVDPDSHDPRAQRTYPSAEFDDLGDVMARYIESLSGERRPESACVAIAAPSFRDTVVFANLHWEFSIEETRRRLGLKRLVMMNDFAALAMAIPDIPEDNRARIGGGQSVPGQPVAVVGPGTGLGVAGLVQAYGRWMPLPGEGGHINFAPSDDEEVDIFQIVRGDRDRVSAERLLCGSGLQRLYRTYCKLDRLAADGWSRSVESALREKHPALENQTDDYLEPSAITERALDARDDRCLRALSRFCAMLGTFSGDMALTYGARGGVCLGGGILPRLPAFLEQSAFRQRFEAKGRMHDYVAAIPTTLITHAIPALSGAAAWLEVVIDMETTRP